MNIKLLRRPSVEAATGLARSTLYSHVSAGLFPSPISIGERSVAWLAHEIEELNRARVAGRNTEEIRALVHNLHEQRKQAATQRGA